MYIHHSLACLSVLIKHKYLIFVDLSLFLHAVSIFWLEYLYILKVHILWCKTGIYSWNFPEKVFSMYEDSLQSEVYQPLFIHNSIKSSWKWLIPSNLPIFLKVIPAVLGLLVSLSKRSPYRRPVFADCLSVSCDYRSFILEVIVIWRLRSENLWCVVSRKWERWGITLSR